MFGIIAVLGLIGLAPRVLADPMTTICDTDGGYDALHLAIKTDGATGVASMYFRDPPPELEVPVTFQFVGDTATYTGKDFRLAFAITALQVPNYYEVLSYLGRLTTTVWGRPFNDWPVYCFIADPRDGGDPDHATH
jgi:hypothetical protein